MTESEVTEKFLSNASVAITPRQAEDLANAVRSLESCDNLKKLANLLTPQ
jgi:hypothetical protein